MRAFIASIIFLALVSSAQASIFESGQEVFISGPIENNVYAAGSFIDIISPIAGDVVFAGANVTVRERVKGDITGVAGSVELLDLVNGDIRLVGGTITVRKLIGGDVIVAGGLVQIEGPINGDAAIGAGIVSIGDVNGSLSVSADEVEILGVIGGNATIHAEKIILGDKARFLNALAYTSPKRIDETRIAGPISYKKTKERSILDELPGTMFSFISSALIGVILLILLPAHMFRTSHGFQAHPLRSALVGLIAVFLIPLICIFLLLTMVGIPLAILIMFIFIIVLFIAKIYVAIGFGMKIFENRFTALLAGLATYYILRLIPVIGGIVLVAVAIVGLGAFVLTFWPTKIKNKRRRRP